VRLLLDTHAFVWWTTEYARLSQRAYNAIQDPENLVHLSAAAVWEVATKHRIGKLPQAAGIVGRLTAVLAEARIEPLPISLWHAAVAGAYPMSHRDPFDRIIAAQAEAEGMIIVTNDRAFRDFPVQTLW